MWHHVCELGVLSRARGMQPGSGRDVAAIKENSCQGGRSWALLLVMGTRYPVAAMLFQPAQSSPGAGTRGSGPAGRPRRSAGADAQSARPL